MDDQQRRATFEKLRDVIKRHASGLTVAEDTPDGYHLDARRGEKADPGEYFGGVRAGKSYVSYYLMPVYVHPELLADASPELLARMQGKSCFNFKRPDDPTIAELERLTEAGFQRFREDVEAGVLVARR